MIKNLVNRARKTCGVTNENGHVCTRAPHMVGPHWSAKPGEIPVDVWYWFVALAS